MECDWQDDVRARAQARLTHKQESRPFGRLRYWALALALALHLGLLIGLRDAMHVPLPQAQTEMQIVFLDSRPPPPMPVPPPMRKQAPPTSSNAHTMSVRAPTRSPSTATPATQSSPPLELFNRNGTIWQPARPIASAPTAKERGEELLQRGHNILHCKSTQFTRTYRYDESLGDRIARKYLVWIGLYGAAPRERLQRHLSEASAACDAE